MSRAGHLVPPTLAAVLLACAALGLSGHAAAAPLPLEAEAIEGGRFSLAEARGRVVLLTVTSRFTRGESTRINAVLAAAAGPVQLISVVEMPGIPSAFRGLARARVREAAASLSARFLIDEDGALAAALGARPGEQVDVYVIGPDGELRGRFVGEGGAADALRLARGLAAAAPPRLAPIPFS